MSPTHFVSNIDITRTESFPEHTVRLDSYCSIIVVRFGILVFVGPRIREVFLSKNWKIISFFFCVFVNRSFWFLFRLNPHINGNFTFTSSAFVWLIHSTYPTNSRFCSFSSSISEDLKKTVIMFGELVTPRPYKIDQKSCSLTMYWILRWRLSCHKIWLMMWIYPLFEISTFTFEGLYPIFESLKSVFSSNG